MKAIGTFDLQLVLSDFAWKYGGRLPVYLRNEAGALIPLQEEFLHVVDDKLVIECFLTRPVKERKEK